jgi:predicted DCC family thiol-disulfide oxidoreductase YuxK
MGALMAFELARVLRGAYGAEPDLLMGRDCSVWSPGSDSRSTGDRLAAGDRAYTRYMADGPRDAASGPIILFDGHCNLCSGWVRFVLAREGRTSFRFASLQSAAGARLLAAHGLPADLQTVVLIEEGRAFDRSTAVARMLRRLRSPWPALGLLIRLLPRPLRDRAYGMVARNRYRWFGRQEACLLPTPAQRERFLG